MQRSSSVDGAREGGKVARIVGSTVGDSVGIPVVGAAVGLLVVGAAVGLLVVGAAVALLVVGADVVG